MTSKLEQWLQDLDLVKYRGAFVENEISFSDLVHLTENDLKELGVNVVSINGSKGKKITALSDWEDPVYQKARADRSSVESLMFTLKFNYDFGRLGRLGHSAVKTEMLEKILAHNQVRTLQRAAQVAEERLKEAA